MKNVIIAVLVGIAVAALGVFIYTRMKAVTVLAAAISDDVVARYVRLVVSRRYDEAYDSCLSAEYQKKTSRSVFVAAHREHVEKYGMLVGWKETHYQHEANLFSSESLIGLNGILNYANRDVFVLYKVVSTAKPYRIGEIFGSPGTSTSLSSGIW